MLPWWGLQKMACRLHPGLPHDVARMPLGASACESSRSNAPSVCPLPLLHSSIGSHYPGWTVRIRGSSLRLFSCGEYLFTTVPFTPVRINAISTGWIVRSQRRLTTPYHDALRPDGYGTGAYEDAQSVLPTRLETPPANWRSATLRGTPHPLLLPIHARRFTLSPAVTPLTYHRSRGNCDRVWGCFPPSQILPLHRSSGSPQQVVYQQCREGSVSQPRPSLRHFSADFPAQNAAELAFSPRLCRDHDAM
ncbi:hypothetical protein BD413DRAFT_43427 [Trametes elegans]|nr:hypothetical protein BD413DRAFT_43427 [Trametes elegans]